MQELEQQTDVLSQEGTLKNLRNWLMTTKDADYNREYTLGLLRAIDRPGMDKLIEYLITSDYFRAPASTKWHGAYEGGLCEHCLKVTFMFIECNRRLESPISEESAVICGTLHDVCKIGLYIKSGKGYKSVSSHPSKKQHAKVSLAIIERYIQLTDTERDIILYHMGLFGCYGFCVEYTPFEMYSAIAKNVAVQVFASCDNEEAHMKECLN